jgi:hypothetical protein
MWASASSFNSHYLLHPSKTFSMCLRLLPRPLVPYIFPSIFPSMACFRTTFLRKIWPFQLPSFVFLYVWCFVPPCLCNTSSFLTWSVQLTFYILLPQHNPDLSRYFWSVFQNFQISAPYKATLKVWHFIISFLKFKSSFSELR